MEPCPWSAKLPFSYILNVWESGTQAQDLHISSYRNLSFQSSVHCRTKLPCMVSWWHHDIMTSLDLWSKKKHLSKAGCNYGLLPNPRRLLHPKKEIFRNRFVIHISTELRNRNHVSSFIHRSTDLFQIYARTSYKQNWQEFWMKVNQNDTSLQRHTMPC